MRARFARLSLIAAAALGVGLIPADDASACGGCFVQQTENTQVSGHRMVLSVSQAETTLWDQITYDGDPSEFAWVLPIRGQVDIGLSSDALFSVLEGSTQVSVYSPQINCQPSTCNDGSFGNAGTSGSGGGSEDPGVTIIAQEVVGPYETVQLTSADPAALNQWLTDHGYAVPTDVQPVITEYVNEGFGFLALRLVPGQGIDSMKPVRITSPGASPELPLRMVAAGTGAITPISLWVLAEGRYEPQNFPSFEIFETELVWDWDTQSSNYAQLRSGGFTSSGGSAWLMEASETYGSWALQQLVDTASYDPVGSGYADDLGMNAVENAQADVAKLQGNIPEGALWITRMSAELSRPALAQDLKIAASADQSWITRTFYVQNEKGTRPECPAPQPCDTGDGTVVDGSSGWETGSSSGGDNLVGSGGCGVAPGAGAPTVTLLGLAIAGLAVSRRRRRAAR
jgi:MYXO-CTERM domain-containing protein